MKKKVDTYFIYLVILLYFVTTFSIMAYVNLLNPGIVESLHFDWNSLIYVILLMMFYSFYILPIIYALILIFKIKNHETIDLKKNSYLLIILFFIDVLLHGLNINAVVQTSFVLKFIVISLLINVFFFFKYHTTKINPSKKDNT